MKLRRQKHFTAEVATSSLNDIMFFLLLFFLIISTVANPSVIKLMLPRAATAQTLSKKQVVLSITQNKQYFLDNKEVLFDNLELSLSQIMQTITEPTIVVRADQSLTVQDLVDVLQIGSKLQLKMVIATDKK